MMFLLLSCVQEEVVERVDVSESVEVEMSFVVEGMAGETKAVMDPETVESVTDVIKNVWVVQYDGVDDGAKLIGLPKYYVNAAAFLNGGARTELVASTKQNTVFIIANTFDPLMTFPKGSTIAELKKRFMTVSESLDLLVGEKNPTTGEVVDKHLVFTGFAQTVIDGTGALEFRLKRNIAKVQITIKNSSLSTADDRVTIKSWQLCQVPSVSFLVNSYDLPVEFPAITYLKSIDYPVEYPVDDLTYGESSVYTVYLPVNKRGVVNAVGENPANKNAYAPNGATYLQINATDKDDLPLTYTFYLGKNLTDDFNILPNNSYSFVFDIQGKGNAMTDSRVKEIGIVDFTQPATERANCYIVNPAKVDGIRRKYMIPVDRVDAFWGGGDYENVTNNTIGQQGAWEVEIIATNFDNSDGKILLTKSTGVGKSDWFEFTVAPSTSTSPTSGNAIIALKRTNMGTQSTPILWSWHLWITDYAPDEAYSKVPTENEYSYSVTGGVVHRYKGSTWTGNGEYAKRFMMDRNLGALDTKNNGTGKGAIYFQYGRKDPIFIDSKQFNVKKVSEDFGGHFEVMVANSIYNPLTLIYPGSRNYWTYGDKYNPENPTAEQKTMLWQDPTTVKNGKNAGGKSIFDPCPPGYCVPKNGTWIDFRNGVTTNTGGQSNRDFPPYTDASDNTKTGVYYWPETSGNDALPTELIFYPTTGYVDAGISVSSVNSLLYVWTSTYYNDKSAYVFFASSSSAYMRSSDLQKNLGFPVRCITSKDAN